MAGFYKCVLRGTAAGQEILNIAYYSTLTPDILAWDAATALELGEAVGDAWVESALPYISSVYSFQGVDVSMVNEDGETISPYVVSAANTGTGGQVASPSTAATVAILKFNCEPVTLVNPHPVPRRSYVALGPIGEDAIASDGQLANLALLQAAFAPAFVQGHLLGATPFSAYRVGRTTTANTSGVGRIVSGTVRPFSSFRRSRMKSPTGA